MEKPSITNLNIGLFFSPENEEKGTMITNALTKAGAIVRVIKDEKELDKVLQYQESELRPFAIIFDSTIFKLDTADALVEAKIKAVAISFSPKGARVIAGEANFLGTFVQEVFIKEPQTT
jgi:hypothetical protein